MFCVRKLIHVILIPGLGPAQDLIQNLLVISNSAQIRLLPFSYCHPGLDPGSGMRSRIAGRDDTRRAILIPRLGPVQSFIQNLLIILVCCSLLSVAQAAIVVNNPKGKVTLTEVYDYQCPHCHRMYPIVEQLMQNNHDLKVRLIPTGILGRGSVMQAAFAYASTKYPGKFAQFNAVSMSSQPLDGKQLVALIKRLGMAKQHTTDILHQPWVEQQEKAGIELIQHYHAGVPLFLIYPTAHPNQKTVLIGEQSLKTLQQAVDHARH